MFSLHTYSELCNKEQRKLALALSFREFQTVDNDCTVITLPYFDFSMEQIDCDYIGYNLFVQLKLLMKELQDIELQVGFREKYEVIEILKNGLTIVRMNNPGSFSKKSLLIEIERYHEMLERVYNIDNSRKEQDKFIFTFSGGFVLGVILTTIFKFKNFM